MSKSQRKVTPILTALVVVAGLMFPLAGSAGAGFGEQQVPFSWGTTGGGPGQFDGPIGVATDAAGNVYVADHHNDRIQKFTKDGTYISEFGTTGTGDGQFDSPIGIAIDSVGNIYVTETGNFRVQKFDSSGTFLLKWGTFGTGDGQFWSPAGIAVRSGIVWVADPDIGRVQRFSTSGAHLLTISAGLVQPSGVAVDPEGNLYVAESGQDRIIKYTTHGVELTEWGSSGTGPGEFNIPSRVAVDRAYNVYVSDAGNDRIQKFTSTGVHITTYGRTGTGNGMLDGPAGLAVGPDSSVYVADLSNDKVQRFAQRVTALAPVDVAGWGRIWRLAIDDAGNLDVTDAISITVPLEIQRGADSGTLVVADLTKVGVGTTTPAATLHVARPDGSANVLVEDTSVAAGRRILMELENNGATGVRLTNSGSANTWEFATAGADNFVISLLGSGGNEFNLTSAGLLRIGPGNSTQLLLTPTGDLTVKGSITDGNGTTLGDLLAEKEALRERLADLEARLAALEAVLAAG